MRAVAEKRTGAPPRCSLCGSSEARLRFRDGPFSLLECAGCGLVFVSPRKGRDQHVAAVYDPTYWRSDAASERGYSDYRGDAALYRRTFRRRWKALSRRLPGRGRALDVGCAAGYFLDVLVEAGWEAFGVEPSESIAATARERHGRGAVWIEPFEDAHLPGGSFDLVTFWDVLEHLADPVLALRRARDLLRPGGRVVIETQNVRSLFARLTGRRWHHFKHAEHLVHFHRGTLREALERAGLSVETMRTRGAGKYVRGDFLVERSVRLSRVLPRLLAPILGGDWSVYVNLRDELIVVAEVPR